MGVCIRLLDLERCGLDKLLREGSPLPGLADRQGQSDRCGLGIVGLVRRVRVGEGQAGRRSAACVCVRHRPDRKCHGISLTLRYLHRHGVLGVVVGHALGVARYLGDGERVGPHLGKGDGVKAAGFLFAGDGEAFRVVRQRRAVGIAFIRLQLKLRGVGKPLREGFPRPGLADRQGQFNRFGLGIVGLVGVVGVGEGHSVGLARRGELIGGGAVFLVQRRRGVCRTGPLDCRLVLGGLVLGDGVGGPRGEIFDGQGLLIRQPQPLVLEAALPGRRVSAGRIRERGAHGFHRYDLVLVPVFADRQRAGLDLIIIFVRHPVGVLPRQGRLGQIDVANDF